MDMWAVRPTAGSNMVRGAPWDMADRLLLCRDISAGLRQRICGGMEETGNIWGEKCSGRQAAFCENPAPDRSRDDLRIIDWFAHRKF